QRGAGFARIISNFVDIGAFEDQLVSTAPTGPQSATEGIATSFGLGSFTDAAQGVGGWKVTVIWGDGSTDTFNVVSQGTLPSLMHKYTEEGTFKPIVQVSDSLNGVTLSDTAQQVFTVTVVDQNVVAMGSLPFTAVEGSASASQAIATFTDPAGAEATANYSATI